MPPLVPPRFLVRVAHPCIYVKGMPDREGESLLPLPPTAILRNFLSTNPRDDFAEVAIAWNEHGIGIRCVVNGKSKSPTGDVDKPRASDGMTFWLDTRDARTSHRASRYCHQFHLLAAGDGPDREEACLVQTKIARALEDAPVRKPSEFDFRSERLRGGYQLEAFFPASTLSGYQPEDHPRLGIYYHVHDEELGDQTLGLSGEFPTSDDPSLWEPLDLVN